MTIQEIFKDANREVDFDNRSYSVKAINNVLQSGEIRITLAKAKQLFIEKNDKSSHYRVFHGSKYWWAKVNNDTYIGDGKYTASSKTILSNILGTISIVINKHEVKEALKLQNSGCGKPCTRCGAKGIIQGFMHVYNGVCFECLGIGYTFKK